MPFCNYDIESTSIAKQLLAYLAQTKDLNRSTKKKELEMAKALKKSKDIDDLVVAEKAQMTTLRDQ